MQLPILYTFIRCPYAMRARIALAHAGIDYERREVNLRDKPAELLQASPKGTVPVLILPNGDILDESLDIVRWAIPDNITDDMLRLITSCDKDFKKNIDHYKYPDRFPDDTEQPEFYRTAATIYIQELETRLQNSKFLFGNEITVADICIFPFTRQFSKVDHEWFIANDYPNLLNWLNNISESTAMQQAMQKSHAWQV